jgi:hypothetical protein
VLPLARSPLVSRERVARLDRPWQEFCMTAVVGPLRGVDVATIDRRWVEIVGASPALPAAARRRAERGPIAQRVEGDVLAHLLHRPPPGPDELVRVLVSTDAGGWSTVAIQHDHSLSDGRSSRLLVPDLLAPVGAPVALAALRTPTLLLVLLGALWHWVRRPSQTLALLRAVWQAGRARTAPAPPASTGAGPSSSGMTVLSRRIDAAATARLRAHRDAHHPSVSIGALIPGSFLAELAARGVRPAGVVTAVDIRRYLPGGARLGGNLASPVPLVLDPAVAPTVESFVAARRAALGRGEALARFLLGHARLALGGPLPARRPETVDTLGLSDLGVIDGWDDMPWAVGPDGPREVVMIGQMHAPGRRIAVYVARLDDALHLTCTVSTDAFDVEAVEDALDAAVHVHAAGRQDDEVRSHA